MPVPVGFVSGRIFSQVAYLDDVSLNGFGFVAFQQYFTSVLHILHMALLLSSFSQSS